MVRRQVTTWFLIAVAGMALYGCYRIADPFLNPIFAAIVLAIVFYPLHTRIESLISQPNVAATISTISVMLAVAIPAMFLGVAVTRELGELYRSLSEKSAAQGGLNPYLMHLMEGPLRLVGRYIDHSQLDVGSALLGWIDQVSRYLVSVGTGAIRNIFSLILGIVVVFFTLFFLFRDGLRIQQSTAAVLPLTGQQAKRFVTAIIIAKQLWPASMAALP